MTVEGGWSRVLMLCLTGLPLAAVAQSGPEVPEGVPREHLQVWLGSTSATDVWAIEDDNGITFRGESSGLPLGGGASQRLWGRTFQYGFEGGGLVSWQSSDIDFASGNGGLLVALDSELVLVDLFVAGVIAVQPRQWLRAYAALGPSIAWGYLSGADEEQEEPPNGSGLVSTGPGSFIVVDLDQSSTDFSAALYGRAGFEFQFANGFTLGVSARYAAHEFDFGDRGTLELDNVQWFATLGGRL